MSILDGTTPGPWRVIEGSFEGVCAGENTVVYKIEMPGGGVISKANAALISAAPSLAAENEKLKAENARLREVYYKISNQLVCLMEHAKGDVTLLPEFAKKSLRKYIDNAEKAFAAAEYALGGEHER